MVRIYKILLFVFGVCCSQLCLSHKLGPLESYAIDNGNYRFVMLGQIKPEERQQYLEKNNNAYKDACGENNPYRSHHSLCESYEITKKYARTGLYVIPDTSNPVWTVNWYAPSVDISSDGIYLIRHGGWMGGDPFEALSFFKNGKLFATYDESDLVDDDSERSYGTLRYRWRKKSVFDKIHNHYYLLTADNNEYTFDMRTGKIIRFNRIVIPSYAATITYQDGHSQEVNDFQSCGLINGSLSYTEDTAKYSLLSVGSRSPKRKEKINMRFIEPDEVVVPLLFKSIQQIDFLGVKENSRILLNVKLRDNSTLKVESDEGRAKFCGFSETGGRYAINPLIISSIVLSAPIPARKQRGIRSKEQRMRWDRGNWQKSMAPLCESINFDQYETIYEKHNLSRLLSLANCHSVAYTEALDKFDLWIREQKVSYLLAKISVNIGDALLKLGKGDSAISLYEHLIEKNKNVPTTRLNETSQFYGRINDIKAAQKPR